MANKVKYGLKNIHIAPITYGTGVSGEPTITYGTIFRLPGAVNLTLDPAGDNAEFYADDTKYFTQAANNGYIGSLEIALVNDDFREKILKEIKDTHGAFFENKNDVMSDFALGFEFDGDAAGKRFWFYNCSVNRPSTASQTTEASKTPVTETLNLTAVPRITDGLIKVMMEKSSTNTAQYNAFFDSVYEETVSA